MFAADDLRDIKEKRRRKRQHSLLLLLFAGLLAFAAAAGGLAYTLRPITLRIAVGPSGSDDHKLIQAMAESFDRARNAVRLSVVVTEGATESVALLGASRADLAVARGDLAMPGEAEAVAIVRKNLVVLWSPSAPSGKGRKRHPVPKIKSIDDLEGHRIGLIGKTPANVALLRLVLTQSGIDPDKVAITQFATDQTEQLAHDPILDAYMTVGPVGSKITSDAVAATARARGEPKFLPIEVSEAIALKHPLYEAEEIPGSVFSASPAWPADKIETISVNHLIVARKSLSEGTVATLAREVFAARQVLTREAPGAPHIKKPDTDKDAALPVHRGAAAYIDGNERSFLDRYGDYFWFSLLLLSAISSAGAWLRQYLRRDEREEITELRNRLATVISRVRAAKSADELLVMQREVDAIISETLDCHDDGAIDEEDLAALGLVLALFDHAITDRRATLHAGAREQSRLRAR